VRFQINQDGAVPLTSPQRPVIHAQDTDTFFGFAGHSANFPEQGIGARWHLEPLSQLGADLAAAR
jgi:hypothetical protein